MLDAEAMWTWLTAAGVRSDDLDPISRIACVSGEVAEAFTRANSRLSRVEQIKRFTILSQDWPPSGDELTPTMKLKRRPIATKYAAVIDAMYDSSSDVDVLPTYVVVEGITPQR
ncbi:hypothetical protein ABQF35_25715 [Mycobacterium syngnathidarum]